MNNNPDLQDLIGKQLKVLDHGFIRLIDVLGNDSAIVQAARVSYGAGTKSMSQDKKLIDYLLRNSHSSPFEMAEIKLHIKCPIFVARQLLRHRTANVNEVSARYSIMPSEFYIPAPENVRTQCKTNRQGRDALLSREETDRAIAIIRENSERAYRDYLTLVNEDDQGNIIDEHDKGIARELARMVLPVNLYTEFYWKIDLHNLMRFIKLRIDLHAQYEIRVYAEQMLKIVKQWVPLTYQAFKKHVLLGE